MSARSWQLKSESVSAAPSGQHNGITADNKQMNFIIFITTRLHLDFHQYLKAKV